MTGTCGVTGCVIPDPHGHGSSSGVTVECSGCAVLKAQLEELRAKLAAVCPVCTRLTCEGTHEKTSAETIMALRAQVEELKLERDHSAASITPQPESSRRRGGIDAKTV